MSINMNGNSNAEYADHEVQVITTQLAYGPGDEDLTTEQVEILDQVEPVSSRGLDSDELAELIGFYRNVIVYVDDEESNTTTEPGGVFIEAELGINLTNSDLVSQANNRNPTSDDRTVTQSTDGIEDRITQARGANYSEPGAIDHVSGAARSAFKDATAGSAGGGHLFQSERQFHFPSWLGSGPYVDRTDDITTFLEMNADNINADVAVEASYVLYWDVQEMPEGRASFARP